MALTAAIGTQTRCGAPPNRALQRISSLPSTSPSTAPGARLSTILPLSTKVCGTITPGRLASTSTCGTRFESTIHWYMARNRYGRLESMACLRRHFLFGFRQRLFDGQAAEQPFGIAGHGLGLGRQLDTPEFHTPENRGNGAIHQRKLIAQKKRFDAKHIVAHRQAFL